MFGSEWLICKFIYVSIFYFLWNKGVTLFKIQYTFFYYHLPYQNLFFMTRPPYLEWRCSSSNKRCYGKTGTSRLAKDYRVALRWYFHCDCPISKQRSVLDFSSKIRDLFFFQKSKKWARMTRKGVFGNFSKRLMVLR